MTDILKFSNAGGFTTKTRYPDMLAGNTVWNPYTVVGSYDSIATITLTASTSSITFSSIPQTYTHLQIRMLSVSNGAGNGSILKFGYNNGTIDSTTSDYRTHNLYGNGSSTGADTNANNLYYPYFNGGAATTSPAPSICDILDYTNVNKYKTTRMLWGYDVNGAGGYVGLSSGLWLRTDAITDINFSFGNSWLAGSSFALYGVKA